MPIYKGSTEVASGNLYKGSTEIQDGYKATDSFYVNEISISFLNFPGTASYVLTGAPGATIPGSRAVSWTATAPGGSAYNGTQTATGVPAGFAFAGGSQGSISNTTTSPNVNFISSVFPNNSTSVDYNTLTVSLPTTAVVSYSYTFTGSLGRSTSCTAFSGSACSVSSNSSSSGAFSYWTFSAVGTGGGGANSCSQSCGVSISSSGGSSSCNQNGGTQFQSATMAMASMPTYAVGNPTGWQSVMYCATVNSGAASSICRGYSVEMNYPPSNTWSAGYTATDGGSCPGAPSAEMGAGSTLPWRLVGRDLNGTASGTWEGRVKSSGTGVVQASDSTST